MCINCINQFQVDCTGECKKLDSFGRCRTSFKCMYVGRMLDPGLVIIKGAGCPFGYMEDRNGRCRQSFF